MGDSRDEGQMRWVAPPQWPAPPQGWSPPAGWQPDPSWEPAPASWQFWQPAPPTSQRPRQLPFWAVRSVADTKPAFKKGLAGTAVVVALLFVVGLSAGQGPDTATPAAAPTQSPQPSATAATRTPPPSISSAPVASSPSPPPPTAPAPQPAASTQQGPASGSTSALALLGTLEIKGRAPKTGYDRDQFGPAWSDVDRNGCDTRNDILGRDLTSVSFKPGTRSCVVLGGTLAEPYTGRPLTFTKQDADAVHIDHVVALSDAWQKGAQAWPADRRLAFANDSLNLLAVDGPANSSKGDGDAATWLPTNKGFRCPMVARQIAVKAKYGLWVTAAEHAAIDSVLRTCPGQAVPDGADSTVAAAYPAPMPPAPQAPAPEASAPAAAAPVPPQRQKSARKFTNCTELRQTYRGGVARPGAVNAGGTTKNQPEYDSDLYETNQKSDRDKDGIACEN
jgi:hypothetical protein